MKRSDSSWDVRVPAEFYQWRAECLAAKKPYYWKVTRAQAREMLVKLAAAYEIPAPNVSENSPTHYGCYRFNGCVIDMWPRAHLKTVVHEFYHHLDHMTGGLYNSNDMHGGPSSLAWQFAERWWEKLTDKVQR